MNRGVDVGVERSAVLTPLNCFPVLIMPQKLPLEGDRFSSPVWACRTALEAFSDFQGRHRGCYCLGSSPSNNLYSNTYMAPDLPPISIFLGEQILAFPSRIKYFIQQYIFYTIIF